VQHAPMQQAAAHLTRFEAEAWCRWAGRRLPAAAEWELAARTQVRLGFAWGDVHEWVLGSALRQTELDDKGPAWPASALDTPSRGHGVLCGASWATPPRWHHAPARRFADPASELLCAGFRSCAL
jgi:gamma-glutamyl hercynylcysteine S-oxide synthase